MRRIWITVCAVVLIAAITLSGQISNSKAADVNTSTVILANGTIIHQSLNIGVYFQSWDLHEYSAALIASTFDMSQSWWVTPEHDYTSKVNAIHALNPNYKALLYRNIGSIYNYQVDEWNIANENGWLVKDSNGNYVSEGPWPSNYIVDITNPNYQNWLASKIESWLTQYPCFDGLMVDGGLIYGAQAFNSACNATSINPRTGAPFTDRQILDGRAAVVNAIIDAIGPSKTVLANGIWSGATFYGSTTGPNTQYLLSQIPSLSGIGSEGLFFQSYTANWYTEAQWQQSLQMLIWIQNNFLAGHPEKVFNGWVPSGSSPSPAGGQQLMMFGFSSMLLGIKYPAQNTIGFGISSTDAPLLSFAQQLRNLRLGAAVNDYYSTGSLYLRDFQGGKVIVNPSTTPAAYSLNQTYTQIDGSNLGPGSVTISPHSGVILLK